MITKTVNSGEQKSFRTLHFARMLRVFKLSVQSFPPKRTLGEENHPVVGGIINWMIVLHIKSQLNQWYDWMWICLSIVGNVTAPPRRSAWSLFYRWCPAESRRQQRRSYQSWQDAAAHGCCRRTHCHCGAANPGMTLISARFWLVWQKPTWVACCLVSPEPPLVFSHAFFSLVSVVTYRKLWLCFCWLSRIPSSCKTAVPVTMFV